MTGNKTVTILIICVIIFIFVGVPFAADQEKARLAEEAKSKAAEEAKRKDLLFEEDAFFAAPKKAEEYNAKNPRAFEVLGAGFSDKGWAVVFGNCEFGAYVTAKVGKKEYAVQSTGGTFALRIQPGSKNPKITFTQSFRGVPIGEPYIWEGTLVRSDSSYDPNQASLIGYENQMFYQKMLPDFSGSNRLSEKQQAALKKKFSRLVKALREKADGCELVTLFGPSPMTIYPEWVPEQYKKAKDGTTRLDQLQALFAECGATVIDLRDTFTQHKNDVYELYCKYDSHWTDYAGYLAYVDLYSYIAKSFPEAAPRPMSDFTWKRGYFNNEDFAYYLGGDSWNFKEYSFRRAFRCKVPKAISGFQRFSVNDCNAFGAYTDAVLGNHTIQTGRKELPDIYVLRNSFSGQMIDIMAERSDNATFRQMFDYRFDLNDIAKKKPDYVILTISEWDLDKLFS